MAGPLGKTLCIPTAFIGYHGEALDHKVPLLRSMEFVATKWPRFRADASSSNSSLRWR